MSKSLDFLDIPRHSSIMIFADFFSLISKSTLSKPVNQKQFSVLRFFFRFFAVFVCFYVFASFIFVFFDSVLLFYLYFCSLLFCLCCKWKVNSRILTALDLCFLPCTRGQAIYFCCSSICEPFVTSEISCCGASISCHIPQMSVFYRWRFTAIIP